MTINEGWARAMAAGGPRTIRYWRDTLARAEELLADPNYAATAKDREVAEAMPVDFLPDNEPDPIARRELYTAGADYSATGEGVTLKFCAGYAADERSFRRDVRRQMGDWHGRGAVVAKGFQRSLPGYATLVSPAIDRWLARSATGSGDRPGAFSVYLEMHYNLS